MEEALVNVPQDLNQFYERTLGRIKQQPHPDSKVAFRVFRWISHASADLTIDQLIHALSLDWGTPADRSHNFDVKNIYRLADVADVCLGLVNIEAHDRSVRFTHDTVKEYFKADTSRLWDESPSASIHGELAATCLTYMAFDDFAQGPCTSHSDFIALTKFYCLLPYAVRHVGNNLRKSGEMDKAMLSERFERLLESDMKKLLLIQVGLYFVGTEPVFESDQFVLAKYPWINLMTGWGYIPIVEAALRRGHSLEAHDLTWLTPLHVSASNGDLELVGYILNLEVNPNQVDWRGQNPAMLAASNGHLKTVKCLIERGGKLSARDITGNTLLAISVYSYQRGILSYIMQQNPNPRFEDWYKAIWYAMCDNEPFSTSRLLLEGLYKSVQREYRQCSLLPMIKYSYPSMTIRSMKSILSLAQASNCEIDIEGILEDTLESYCDQDLAVLLLEVSGTRFLPDPSFVICHAVSLIQGWDHFLNRSRLSRVEHKRLCASSGCQDPLSMAHRPGPVYFFDDKSKPRSFFEVIDLILIYMQDDEQKRHFELLLAKDSNLAVLESMCQSDALPEVKLLCIVCRLGEVEVARSLAKRSSNLNEKYKGCTPLENAAMGAHCAVIDLLLDLGADDLEGAIRKIACSSCALKLLKIDLRKYELCYQRHGNALSVLGKSNLQLNAESLLNEHGMIQYHLDLCLVDAGRSANLKAVRFVLELGANPRCNIHGYPPGDFVKGLVYLRTLQRSNPKLYRRNSFHESQTDAIIESLSDPKWQQRDYSAPRK